MEFFKIQREASMRLGLGEPNEEDGEENLKRARLTSQANQLKQLEKFLHNSKILSTTYVEATFELQQQIASLEVQLERAHIETISQRDRIEEAWARAKYMLHEHVTKLRIKKF